MDGPDSDLLGVHGVGTGCLDSFWLVRRPGRSCRPPPLPRSLPVGTGQFWINPTVGFAAGSIRQTPEGTVDAGPFSRLLAGATAIFEIPVFFGKMLTLNAEYAYRRQIQHELVGPRTVASGVHQWRRASTEVAFNDFVAFGVVFQDGEQPPVYKKVTRSLVFDLTFKAARK